MFWKHLTCPPHWLPNSLSLSCIFCLCLCLFIQLYKSSDDQQNIPPALLTGWPVLPQLLRYSSIFSLHAHKYEKVDDATHLRIVRAIQVTVGVRLGVVVDEPIAFSHQSPQLGDNCNQCNVRRDMKSLIYWRVVSEVILSNRILPPKSIAGRQL